MNKPYSMLIVLLIILSSCTQTKKQTDKQPNLLIIFTDQHRRQAMEFWQQPEYQGVINGVSDPVFTPNLNRLASEGVIFTQAMSTHPVCSPHRAMLLSGTFPATNGVGKNCHINSDTDLTCIIHDPQSFQKMCFYNLGTFKNRRDLNQF